ncbi:MAG TPA: DUF58 domain-containing protein [Gaiellaceae bacterium]|nr:DUF58 domain-containing protein [Gaiellaceae bacterium]
MTAKLPAYAGVAALGLLAALATRRPELAVIAAPFALYAGLGLLLARPPRLDAEVELEAERALEGDELEVRVTLVAEIGADRVEVLLELPRELVVADGFNPAQLRLADGERRELRFRLRCARWGAFRVGRIYLRAHDPFGLFVHETTLDRRQPLKVYPSEEHVRDLLKPLETQVFAGNHVAREKGEGIEFADLRPFVPGDRIRHVNWRATARRGELWINEHHAERNADVVLLLDSFAEARRGDRSTLDPALRAAGTLAARYLRQKDRVGFVTFGGILNWLLPTTGAVQLYRIVDAMLDTKIVLSYAWRDIATVPRRTLPPQALVIALTPLLDDRSEAALLDLRGRGFDLVVVEISPLSFLPDPRGELGWLADRLWRLRREAVRGRFERAGVPVALWGDETSLAAALEEVSAYRRRARVASA